VETLIGEYSVKDRKGAGVPAKGCWNNFGGWGGPAEKGDFESRKVDTCIKVGKMKRKATEGYKSGRGGGVTHEKLYDSGSAPFPGPNQKSEFQCTSVSDVVHPAGRLKTKKRGLSQSRRPGQKRESG